MGKYKLNEYTFQTSLLDEDDDFNLEDSEEETNNQVDNNNNDNVDDNNVDDTDFDVDEPFDDSGVEDIDVEQEGDEVIDVTDIINNQTNTDNKINQLMNQFKLIFNKVDTLTKNVTNVVSKTDKKIDAVKSEITTELEKRLPTDAEKMNIRTLDSGPFSVSVGNYWNNKSQDNRYDVTMNNKPEEEYVLTQDDIDKEPLNSQYISKTLNSDYTKSLSDIFPK